MRRFAYTLLFCLVPVACSNASAGGSDSKAAPQKEQALKEAEFLDSLGINAHLNYTDGAYASLDRVAHHMRYLGLVHVRTHGGGKAVSLEDYAELAAEGLRFNLLATADRIDESVDFAARLAMQEPGSVVSVEGFNEINNWPVTYRGNKGEAAARAAQAALYAKVRARAELDGVPILYFTGGQKADEISGMADIANVHAYSNNAMQPRPFILNALRQYSGTAGRLPQANTEFGNFTLPDGWPKTKPYWANYTQLGVDHATQAKIVLNAFFEGAELGISRSYVYELLDQKADPDGTEPEFHFGLFTFEHRPKASAKAIHQLTAFLERTRSNRLGRTVEAELENADDAIGKLAIRREDGSLLIALWNRSQFWRWDEHSSEPTDFPRLPATLRAGVGRGGVTASVFDPVKNTVSPADVGDEGVVDLAVPDYPVLIWFQAQLLRP